MASPRTHLAANLIVTTVVYLLCTIALWSWFPGSVQARVVLSVVLLTVTVIIGHRLLPKLVGPWLDRFFPSK